LETPDKPIVEENYLQEQIFNTDETSLFWKPVAYPGILFGGGGGSTISVEDRENRDLEAVASLVRGSGGSCNLVQEISFHTVKFS
jgi:hypothetical protein